MKNLTRGVLLVVIAFALTLGPALQAAGDVYAAIARARRECGRRDARTNWCKNAWIALAVSNQSAGGWGSSWGETPEIARSKAIAECLARNPDAHVVLCVSAYR